MRHARNEIQRFAGFAHGQNFQPAFARGFHEIGGMSGVGVDDRDAMFAHDFGKQAQLRREIALEILVIVQMIARDVGEPGGGDVHRVEAVLIEPVAGGFQRQTIDAVFRQPREQRMNFNRIGCGVLQRDFARWRHHADGSHAGGLAALMLPRSGAGKRRPRFFRSCR